MRFVLLVEGDTEKLAAGAFLKRWLAPPRLKQLVKIDVRQFRGNTNLARKIVDRAQMHLDDPRQTDVIAVVGLLDLYAPDFYPGHVVGVKERHDWGVAHFVKQVNRKRFRMFFAVHEFEAWLLSQPEIFPTAIRSAFPGKIAQPEQVNFDEHPSKLLGKLYKGRLGKSYKKTVDGKNLFAKLDPDVAVGKCPYLKAMLDEMVKLAKAAEL